MPGVQTGETYSAGSIERPEDITGANKSEGKISAKYLLEEYELSCKRFQDWEQASSDIVRRYQSISRMVQRGKKHVHNVLFSNVETQRPSLYSDKPIPNVRRRFADKDPVARRISEMTERALSFTLDDYDFDGVASDIVLDFLLVGRPTARIRYSPEFKEVPEEIEDLDMQEGMVIPEDAEYDEEREVHFIRYEAYDELDSEKVTCELVQWDRFKHGSGRVWEEVDWCSFDHYFTREEFEENFPKYPKKKADELKFVDSHEGSKYNREGKTVYDAKKDATVLKQIKIVEFWHRPTKKIYFVAESNGLTVKEEDDKMGLKNFFPVPKPIFTVESTSDLIPVPDFLTYKDQADELDKLTQRIQKVVSAIKARGVYDPSLGLERLFQEDDNKLVPANQASKFYELGGLQNAIWMLPIEKYAEVLDRLYQAREATKLIIYEITGISDIMRGATDPRETKGAQAIKSQWGSTRIKRKQFLVEKYFRDILRMKAEIICTKFDPETIEKMTGLKFQVDGPPDPKTGEPSVISPKEETITLMQDDVIRSYRVDVETDSTVAGMMQSDQQNITRLLQGIATYVQGMSGAVMSGYIPQKSASKILLAGIRRFKFGREVEDAIEAIGDQPPPDQNKPDPEVEKQKALLEIKKEELELKKQEMQMKAEIRKMESQSKVQISQQEAQSEMQMSMQEMKAEMDLEREKAMTEMQLEREKMKAEIAMDYEEMRAKINIEEQKAIAMASIARTKAENTPKKENGNVS